ncbi:MAG: ribosomal-processing cysteine protease Prp [Oscillospiraceae bacterium]|nr:ribosomal-processing cysteine protease Prp [Oscillospiraceae bacterium]
MIIVRILRKQNDLLGFDIKGHAGEEEAGENIVCAAVSSAAHMAINTITDVIHAHAQVYVDPDGALFARIISGYNQSCNDVLKGLESHLVEISKEFPHAISIRTEEII